MDIDIKFPYSIEDVDKETSEEINSYFKKPKRYVFVGTAPYLYPDTYKTYGPQFYSLSVRPDDIFLVGHPRSGTTWTQEMTWLLNNNLDYETAKSVDIDNRFPLLDMCLSITPESHKEILNNIVDEEKKKFLKITLEPAITKLERAPSPRFIKTHLPLSLLPPNLLDIAKVVYIARDPRDVIASLFNIYINYFKEHAGFNVFWSLFKRGLIARSTIFSHLKEALELRGHPNMIFLLYEDLSKDLPGTVKRLTDFFGKTYSEDQVQTLCDHLNFENFKANDSVNQTKVLQELGVVNEERPFIREGKVGGWRHYFKGDLEADVEKWMIENLADTDFTFPTFDKINK